MIQIGMPQTPAELAEYFELRWQVLRAPWGQPRGSERDDHDGRADADPTTDPVAAGEPPRTGGPSPGGTGTGTGDRSGDATRAATVHATARDPAGGLVAIGRLHFNSPDEAQIRYMATTESHRGQGAGRAIAEYLEAVARARGARRIVLNARDSAVGFYERLGYTAAGIAPKLFDTIPHTRMQKRLEP